MNEVLALASYHDISFALRRFLEAGVNPDILLDGKAAIHHAVMTSYSTALEILLQAGANVNLLTRSGTSALYLAAKH